MYNVANLVNRVLQKAKEGTVRGDERQPRLVSGRVSLVGAGTHRNGGERKLEHRTRLRVETTRARENSAGRLWRAGINA